jgi:hypothetical protein
MVDIVEITTGVDSVLTAQYAAAALASSVQADLDADRSQLYANNSSKINFAADIAGLKTFTGMANLQPALVENRGMFVYSSGSSATADDIDVVQPTTGGGRWLRQLAAPYISQQATYRTMTQAVADNVTIAAGVAAGKPRIIKLLGGRIEGDGGACEVIVTPVTGAETTITQNGLTVAPGFQVMMGSSIKMTWPDNRVNAIAMGMRTVDWATVAESITANDAFMNRADPMFANRHILYFPQGNYWHRDNRVNVLDKDFIALEGDGIGRTIFNQGDFYEVDGVTPKYDDGTGTAVNPSIPLTAAFQFLGGKHGTFEGISYNARWMRYRGFWMRQGYGLIDSCYAEETCNRTFALSNEEDTEPGTLNGTLFNGEMRNCRSYRSVGTAFSMYGQKRAKISNCRVDTCWAEGFTTDACDQAEVIGNYATNICRQDDAAGTPMANLLIGVSGAGGIGGMGLASCSQIRIIGNMIDGIGQDNAASTTRVKPHIKWRPQLVPYNTGGIFQGNTLLNGFVGIRIMEEYDVAAARNQYCRSFVVEGNTMSSILTNSGQGHVQIDEGCVKGVVTGNTTPDTFKIHSLYNINVGNQNGTVDDTTGHVSSTVAIANNKG